MRAPFAAAAAAGTLLLGACSQLGALGGLVQPPRISAASGYEAQLRITPPSLERPLGGASIRLYARVENPNSFGLRLARLAGNLLLEGERAAEIDFPLGLPLTARQDTVVPIDIGISFSDLGDLAGAAGEILSSNRVHYRVDGTVTLDAGALGQPTFGPQTWLRGEARVFR